MGKGRVIKGVGGFYYIYTEKGTYECKARGIFRKMNITPLVGDYVEITAVDEDKKTGVIEEIKVRSNELNRPAVANIDQAMIVFAVTQPDPDIVLLDRFLLSAESQRIRCVICFNKTDLIKDQSYKKYEKFYEKAGYKMIFTNYLDDSSIKELQALLCGKTTVFAGPSGVGKSSLLNKIQPDLKLKTGEISTKIGRGKHTTRHAELVYIKECGWVVDTPGFSLLELNSITEEELTQYFPEFALYLEGCRFSSCVHMNEPDCAIKKAVKEGFISESRYKSYIQFMTEIKNNRRF